MLTKVVYLFLVFLASPYANAESLGYGDPVGMSSAYEGFFVSTSFGYGELSHESFTKKPIFSSLGLGLGYDYFFLSNVGVGLSANATYNHQIVDGESVGGTYSGLGLNPINARLVFSLMSIGVAAEYHILPTYDVNKANSVGDKIKWSKGTGFSLHFTFPWKILSGNFGIVYHIQNFKKQEIGALSTDVENLKSSHILLQLEFRNLFASDMSAF